MALAAINVKKPREAQIGNCCTEKPVLRILPDSNNIYMVSLPLAIPSNRKEPSYRLPFLTL